jgi:hypothetical protein
MLHDRFDVHGNDRLLRINRPAPLTTTPAYVPTHPTPTLGGDPTAPEPVTPPAPVVPEPVPAPEPVVPDAPDFAAMTREALRTEAKRLGVPGMGRMLKDDLLAAVEAAHKALAA